VGNPTGKKLGISVDSLHRLTWRETTLSNKTVLKEKFFQTVIIEESEQVLRHFLSDTIEPDSRDQLFKIFRKLLQKAERVIVLDADLDWLSFETISKMAQPRDEDDSKRSTVILNERSTVTRSDISKQRASHGGSQAGHSGWETAICPLQFYEPRGKTLRRTRD
jgi:hypothetical protein